MLKSLIGWTLFFPSIHVAALLAYLGFGMEVAVPVFLAMAIPGTILILLGEDKCNTHTLSQ